MTSKQKGLLDPVRVSLEQKLNELRSQLGRVEDALSSPHSKAFAEQAAEREQDEALAGQEQVFERELSQITAAIARIDDGTYGECAKCGEEIGAQRLAVQPEAPLCMACAS